MKNLKGLDNVRISELDASMKKSFSDNKYLAEAIKAFSKLRDISMQKQKSLSNSLSPMSHIVTNNEVAAYEQLIPVIDKAPKLQLCYNMLT